ncbi:MAG: Stf0 family sulfotransferase [Acidimicrobiales bacterium]
MAAVDSYLICATPRTGSSLLCGLLDSTGRAGHPESYFRAPDLDAWARRWHIAGAVDGTYRYGDFVEAAVAAGRTGNGVFGARIMWGTLDELVAGLRLVVPDPPADDAALLGRMFGRTAFVWLRRHDDVAQAVSWFRSEQEGVWVETTAGPRPRRRHDLRYSADGISDILTTIRAHNRAWRSWFTAAGIEPHPVDYGDLEADPVGVVGNVFATLGLEPPAPATVQARHRRMADDVNAEWIARYRAGAGD